MRHRAFKLILLLIAMAAGGFFAWQRGRLVDGRTAAQWLALTHQAAQSITYQAAGSTTFNGQAATFTLTQGAHGRYLMNIVTADNRRCTMGDDGQFAWYRSAGKTVRTASAQKTDSLDAACRILGTGTIAGRPVVRICAKREGMMKELTLDRQTGVVLEMLTREGRREVSHMRVNKITFTPVTISGCPKRAITTIHPATSAEITKLLGTKAPEPGWLPAGMTLRGVYRETCSCCQTEMGVFRYADGLRSLTMFAVAGMHHCAMAEGCHMAPTGDELLDSRTLRNVTVIAVGSVEQRTIERVLGSLR